MENFKRGILFIDFKCFAFGILLIYFFRRDLKFAISAQDEKATLEVCALVSIKHEETQNKICAFIESSTTIHERFWDMLADNEPSYEYFLSLGLLIKSLDKRIKILWKHLKKSNIKLTFKILSIYASYIENILQDIEKSNQLRKLMAVFGVLTDGDLLLKHADNGDAVIAVNASVQNIGRIRKHNYSFCELTGYTKEELYNIPLEAVIPAIYRESHYAKYTNTCFALQNEQTFEFEQRSLFILHKSGFIIPVVLRIVSSPSLANSYCFIARLTKDKLCNEFNTVHILTNPQYIITATSSSKVLTLNV